MKYVASVSFGKDSLAMVLLLIENKMPLDEIVFYDTGMEFDELYSVMKKASKLFEENKIKFTILKPKRPFIDTMLNYQHYSRNGKLKNGYGWCGEPMKKPYTLKERFRNE